MCDNKKTETEKKLKNCSGNLTERSSINQLIAYSSFESSFEAGLYNKRTYVVVSITSWRQNGAKSNRRGRKRLGTSLCKPVAGSLPAPTRANLAEVQGSCTVIPVICERFDALCLLWNHGAISVKFVTVTLYKAIFNARRKEGSLRSDFH